MKHLGAFVGAVMMGLLVGCGPVEEGMEETGEESSRSGVLSSEQVDALLTRMQDPDDVMYQPLVDVCSQPANVNGCYNAGYQSCGSWSGYTDCGLSSCSYTGCRVRVCDELGCYFEPRGSQTRTRVRYRVCFNAAQQACTEYERTLSTVCGCGEL